MKSDTTLKLGDIAKDTITGFSGVVVARCDWLNGCVRMTIQPKGLKDSKPIEAQTFDVEQLVLVKAKQHPEGTRSGGPMPNPVR
jgi:hypothetical protein